MSIQLSLAYDELDKIKELFQEYTGSLNVDLTFQHYDEELESLPGAYGLPDGRLYLAVYDGQPAGCIALKRIHEEICEMKRLYVRPAFRKCGLGLLLVNTILDDAKTLHYKTMYLDTLSSLNNAIKLYERLGFYEIPPYYHNPLDSVRYMALDL